MPGPVPGIPYLGCCGGLGNPVEDRVLEVYVNDFANTAQVNLDFAEGYLDAYDMTTIPLSIIRRVTFSSITGVPTVQDLNAGSVFVSGTIGQLLFLSQPRIRAGRTVCVTGPLPSACRYHYKPGTGEIIECSQNAPLPQDVKALPDLSETSPTRAEVRFLIMFPGYSNNLPPCCTA